MKITENKFTKTPGIYVWTNTVNGKVYVGQSINVFKRVREELNNLRKDNFHNEHMQRAWNKYGEDAFIVDQVMECDFYELDEAEALWGNRFDARNPEFGYNIKGYGQNNYSHAVETIDKIRETHHAKYEYFARSEEIIRYCNMGLNYSEIQKLTGATRHAIHVIINENQDMLEPVKMTKVEAYECVKAGIIKPKAAARLAGFNGVKYFNTCYRKWLNNNDN